MKYYLKKNLIAIIIAIIAYLFIVLTNFASTFVYDEDVFEFNAFKIDATVNEDGSMDIRELITVRFDEDTNGEFWRDIVTSKNNAGDPKNTSSMDINSFSMKIYDASMTNVLYDSTTGNSSNFVYDVGYSWNNDKDYYGDYIKCVGYSNCECAYSYLNADLYPVRVYEFNYTLEGFVTYYNDIAEINNNFFEPISSIKIRNVEVTINLPGNIAAGEIDLFTHRAIVDEEIVTNSKVYYTIPRIYPGDAIESRVLFPNNVITSIPNKNKLDKDGYETLLLEEENIEKENILIKKYGTIATICIAIALLVILFISVRGAYIKFDKERKSTFDSEYYRELPDTYPPAIMGYLVNFQEVNKEDLTATLMDLIRKGFIEVDYSGQSLTDKDANYKLIYNRNKNQNELKEYEKYTLTWFFDTIGRGQSELYLDDIEEYTKKMSNAEKYEDCNVRWNNLVKNDGKKYDFFDSSPTKALKSRYGSMTIFVLVISILALFINHMTGGYILLLPYIIGLLVSLSIVAISYMMTIKKRSEKGNEDYLRWMAFKRFLEEFGNMEDYPIPALTIWEHYLVYATSFGIAELVNKQLKMKFTDKDYYESPTYRTTTFNYYFYYRMNRCYINHQHSLAQHRQKQASSSGRGRFGGGGSFGGGGGGARGR